MKKFIGYYRVSSKMQGVSGLGLSAQKTTVEKYIQQQNGVLLNEYTEVETGTNKRKRVAIYQAITEAKKQGAILVIAKIDRLARNVSFVSSLMDTGVEFVACDLPQATPFTIHIFAALAEQEAKLISTRTKSALQELKRKGVKLGNPTNFTKDVMKQGIEAHKANARGNDKNRQASAVIVSCREKDMTFQQIADHLNGLNFTTRYGCKFAATAVKRLFDRAKLLND